MPDITNGIIYTFLFTSLFYEVFLLITYFERRDEISAENKKIAEAVVTIYPTVSIIIPCWNEETTLSRTVNSLLELNYPKDKLTIMIVDDGSTDNTLAVAQSFTTDPQIVVHTKPNGGKHTALNFGLEHTQSEYVGCLDADSFVHPDALRRIVAYFQNDPKLVAVTPAIEIWKPKTFIQIIQKVEYGWGIFIRKMFSYLNAMYVCPGPFSIFKRSLFDEIGPYRKAYLTEDMELALRIQSHHLKMANAHNARIYTVGPNTLYKLYKQRLRWTYGFIKNALDYRYMFFSREYGNLGFFVLPIASLSIVSAIYIVATTLASLAHRLSDWYVKFQTVGFHLNLHGFAFDWFFIHTEFISIATVMAFCGTIGLLFISRKMAEGHMRPGLDMLYFLCCYAFIDPLWLSKAVFNAAFSVKTRWR